MGARGGLPAPAISHNGQHGCPEQAAVTATKRERRKGTSCTSRRSSSILDPDIDVGTGPTGISLRKRFAAHLIAGFRLAGGRTVAVAAKGRTAGLLVRLDLLAGTLARLAAAGLPRLRAAAFDVRVRARRPGPLLLGLLAAPLLAAAGTITRVVARESDCVGLMLGDWAGSGLSNWSWPGSPGCFARGWLASCAFVLPWLLSLAFPPPGDC